MSRKMMLLVNPHAGKSGYKGSLGEVLEVFCRNGWQPTVFFTSGPGQAPEIVRKNSMDYEMVVCIGGDGTLSEVSSGIMRCPQRRPIGYIPLGTANDVARTLALPSKPVQAAESIVKGKPIPFDIGLFGQDKYFTYVAGFGAFTEVSYATPQEYKQALGHLAYMLEGMKRLSKLRHYKAIVEYDGGVISDDFIFGAVMNTTSVAGLVRIAGDKVDLSDGQFEILLVKTPQDILDLNDILTAVLSNNFSGSNVMFLRSREVRIMFEEPVAWTRDGEDGGLHRDVMITNCHPGVEIIV